MPFRLLFFVLLLYAAAPSHAEAQPLIFYVQPQATEVVGGDVLTVDLVLGDERHGMGDVHAIKNLLVFFDAARFAVTHVQPGPVFQANGPDTELDFAIDNRNGVVGIWNATRSDTNTASGYGAVFTLKLHVRAQAPRGDGQIRLGHAGSLMPQDVLGSHFRETPLTTRWRDIRTASLSSPEEKIAGE